MGYKIRTKLASVFIEYIKPVSMQPPQLDLMKGSTANPGYASTHRLSSNHLVHKCLAQQRPNFLILSLGLQLSRPLPYLT